MQSSTLTDIIGRNKYPLSDLHGDRQIYYILFQNLNNYKWLKIAVVGGLYNKNRPKLQSVPTRISSSISYQSTNVVLPNQL